MRKQKIETNNFQKQEDKQNIAKAQKTSKSVTDIKKSIIYQNNRDIDMNIKLPITKLINLNSIEKNNI